MGAGSKMPREALARDNFRMVGKPEVIRLLPHPPMRGHFCAILARIDEGVYPTAFSIGRWKNARWVLRTQTDARGIFNERNRKAIRQGRFRDQKGPTAGDDSQRDRRR